MAMNSPNHQDIAYNGTDAGGQVLYLDAPEGRPSSVVSVRVMPWDAGDDSEVAATTGSPSVETNPNTTFDAASGFSQATPRVLNLAATTGIAAGRTYLATDGQGRKEWPEIVAVSSGASATARNPLALDYVNGDSFVSTRMTIALDADWCANAANISDDTRGHAGYRVRWIYDVAGVTYVRYTYFDLVRVRGQHNVRPGDVEILLPGFLDNLPHNHQDDGGRGLIDEAYRQVAMDLRGMDIPDETVRDAEIVDELVKHRAVLLWAEARAIVGGDMEALEIARARWSLRWTQLVRGPSTIRAPLSSDKSSAATTRETVRLTVR